MDYLKFDRNGNNREIYVFDWLPSYRGLLNVHVDTEEESDHIQLHIEVPENRRRLIHSGTELRWGDAGGVDNSTFQLFEFESNIDGVILASVRPLPQSIRNGRLSFIPRLFHA